MKIHVQTMLSRKSASAGRFFKLGWLTFGLAVFSVAGVYGTGMSGKYTVQASGGSYTTINAAYSALKTNGVSGPVVISIAKGTWSEDLSITAAIKGISSTNTVTFEGQGMFNTIMSSSSTVISVSSSTYINFRNLELKGSGTNTVSLSSGAKYINFIKCNITNSGTTGYTIVNDACADDVYDSCYMSGGGTYEGVIEMESTTAVTIENSRITQFPGYYTIYAYNGGTSNVYSGNYIDSGTSSNVQMAIYSIEENGVTIENNVMPGESGGYWYEGIFMEEDNESSHTIPCLIINNIVGPNFYEYGLFIYGYSSSGSINTKVLQNTFIGGPSSYYDAYIEQQASGLTIENNDFDMSGSDAALELTNGTSGITAEDGNNFYHPGGDLVNGSSTLSSWQSTASSSGFAVHDQNEQFYYTSTYRCQKNVPEPYAPGVGVTTDIDGNPRCKVFPTIGASESTYGKGAFKAGIYGPDSAFVGSPVQYTNYTLPGSPIDFTWYVNGKFAGNAADLDTVLGAGTVSIELIEEGCAGTDTSYFSTVVDTPKAPPVSNFVANYNTIIQGQDVQFYDLSTNGPSSWRWSILPDSTFDPILGYETATWAYINNADTFSQNPAVQFLYSGNYSVCLTASNAKGPGSTDCQPGYITVTPAISMCSQNTTNANSGTLYDDGGSNGTINYGVNCPLIIAPCGDTAYLVFDSFNMTCNQAFLQIYDGIGGHALTSLHATVGQPTSGFTSCSGSTAPIIGDTFVSYTGKFYIVENTNTNLSGSWPLSQGFVAKWSGRNTASAPPVAKIISAIPSNDSICLNGQMSFYADSTNPANKNATYLWALYGNPLLYGFSGSGTSITSIPYTATGPDTVTLVVMTCGGSDTTTLVINVDQPVNPVSTFSADNTTPGTTDIVFFSPTSVQCVDVYQWTFFDPNGGIYTFQDSTNGSSKFPQVIFKDTGCWTVSLFESTDYGQDTDTKTIPCYIHVKGSYCQPSVATSIQDIGLNSVTLNTIDNSTLENRTGDNNYLSDSKLSTTLQEGLSYTLKLGRESYKNDVDILVLVDWKGDKTFTDAGDTVYYGKNLSGQSWSISNIMIPKGVKSEATALRIIINKSGTAISVCGPDEFGDYEDYRLYLTPFNTPPVITLTGPDTLRENEGVNYVDPGYTATSELYGNITKSVIPAWPKAGSYTYVYDAFYKSVPGTYVLTYNVTDAAGNKAIPVKRVVIVLPGTVPPILHVLCNGNTDTVEVNTYFIDPVPCIDSDYVDGLLTPDSMIGSVNVGKLGLYRVIYYSSDVNGNMAIDTLHVLVVDTFAPVIQLNGHDTIRWVVNTPFTGDDSLIVIDSSREYVPLIISSDVNTSVMDTYTVTYNATDVSGNKATPLTLYVIVYDPAPALTMNGSVTDTVEVNTRFNDPGVIGTDDYDKTVNIHTKGSFINSFGTTYIPTRLGKYQIMYYATNSSGETTTVTRTIIVIDNVPPVITLNGANPVNVCRWQTYTDSGYTVTDNYSKRTGANRITIDTFSNINMSVPDIYYIYFRATDSVGNVSYSAKRFVNVSQEGACLTGINGNKTLGDYISLYPNPSTGEFVIDLNLPKQENMVITITNVMGEVVQSFNSSISSGKQAVDLSAAASGMYFVNITTNTETVTKKITITK